MTIKEKINNDLKATEQNFYNDPEFIKLKEFYEEALRLGIVQRPEYNIPPLDTIGRTRFQSALNT